MKKYNTSVSQKKAKHYKICYGKLAFLIIAFFMLIMVGSKIVNAADSSQTEYSRRCYESISIQKGDTLWGIANEYCSSDMDVNDYIEELIQINNLPSTQIKYDTKLIVFYYE